MVWNNGCLVSATGAQSQPPPSIIICPALIDERRLSTFRPITQAFWTVINIPFGGRWLIAGSLFGGIISLSLSVCRMQSGRRAAKTPASRSQQLTTAWLFPSNTRTSGEPVCVTCSVSVSSSHPGFFTRAQNDKLNVTGIVWGKMKAIFREDAEQRSVVTPQPVQ